MVQSFLTFGNIKFFIFCSGGGGGKEVFLEPPFLWSYFLTLPFSILFLFIRAQMREAFKGFKSFNFRCSQCRCLDPSWLAVDLRDSLWCPNAAKGVQGEIWPPESGICLGWGLSRLSILLPKGHACYWSALDWLCRRAQVISLCYKRLDSAPQLLGLAFQVPLWDSGLFGGCPGCQSGHGYSSWINVSETSG